MPNPTSLSAALRKSLVVIVSAMTVLAVNACSSSTSTTDQQVTSPVQTSEAAAPTQTPPPPAPATTAPPSGTQVKVVDENGFEADVTIDSWSVIEATTGCSGTLKGYAARNLEVKGSVAFPPVNGVTWSSPFTGSFMATTTPGVTNMICEGNRQGVDGMSLLVTTAPQTTPFDIVVSYFSLITPAHPQGDFSTSPWTNATLAFYNVTKAECASAATNGFTSSINTWNPSNPMCVFKRSSV